MAKRNPSDTAGPGARQPRKPQTIEIEATDVSAGASSAASVDAPLEDTAAPSERDGIAWLPSGSRGPIIGAILLGVAGLLLALAMFWFSGVTGGGSGASADRLAAIEAQLRELSGRPVSLRNSNDPKAVDDLSNRISRLENTASSTALPLSDPALANRLASAENATKAFADNIGALNSRTDDLAAAMRDLRNRMDATPPADKAEVEALSNRIAALEKSTGTFESELGKRATIASDRAVRLALATNALRTAVERGEPFTGELVAARPLAPDGALAGLEPFAAAGVPSNNALARELSALMPALRRAAEALPTEGGFFDRLKANALRLVRIRPADEIPGDEPAAIITRIDLKAAQADLAGALADLAKLPPPVRAPAQAWIDKAHARIAAVEASRQIAADAINALGKATP
jgi:hypothetical protein